MSVVPAALQTAIAGHVEHQLDNDAGRYHGANQGAALASQMLLQAALHIAIQRDADIVAGVGERTLEVQQVDVRLAHAAQASATEGEGSKRLAIASARRPWSVRT